MVDDPGIPHHPDGGSVLQMGKTAQQRLTAMLATWEARKELLESELYLRRGNDAAYDVTRKELAELNDSVVYALASMCRLGGLAMGDNQDPPSLILSTTHLTYGVSVLRQSGMKWSVDS